MLAVTALVITYRRPVLLARTIRSIMAQSYANVKIVICDDASNDETKDIVNQFANIDSRIEYHCNATNIGAVDNYRISVSHVETELFSFVSDDEILLPEFYELAVAKFMQYPEIAFASMGVLCVDENNCLIRQFAGNIPQGYYGYPQGIIALSKYGPPIWSGTCFRSNVITEFGGPGKAAALALDHDYLYRIGACHSFYISTEPCVIFPIHSGQISSNLFVDIIFNNRKEIVSEVNKGYEIASNEIRKVARNNIINNANRHLFIALTLAFVYDEVDRLTRVAEASRSTPFSFIRHYSSLLVFACRSAVLKQIVLFSYRIKKSIDKYRPIRSPELMESVHLKYIKSLESGSTL